MSYYPNVYASQTGPLALSTLDANFNFAVDIQSQSLYAAAGGTSDAITATYTPAITSLISGLTVYLRAAAANTTTTPNFTPNGIGTNIIVKTNNQPLVAGDIAGAGHILILQYDATNGVWELVNPATILSSKISGIVAVANGGTGLSSGTSGGVPYYSSTSTIASSAALAANALLVGGGAGAAPLSITTGTGVTTALGFAANTASGGITTIDGTATLTNKRINPRVSTTTANTATYTVNTDNYDMLIITGQTVAITSITTSGTPVNGQKFIVSITSTNTSIAFSGTYFESSGSVTLPTSVTSGTRLDVGFIYNVATSKWRCVAAA